MPRRDRNLLAFAAVASALALVVAASAGHVELLAYAAPLAVLALPLLSGRYVGEEQIARIARRGVRRPRFGLTAASAPRPRLAAFVPRGGRLIADSLAVRPPPAPALS